MDGWMGMENGYVLFARGVSNIMGRGCVVKQGVGYPS